METAYDNPGLLRVVQIANQVVGTATRLKSSRLDCNQRTVRQACHRIQLEALRRAIEGVEQHSGEEG